MMGYAIVSTVLVKNSIGRVFDEALMSSINIAEGAEEAVKSCAANLKLKGVQLEPDQRTNRRSFPSMPDLNVTFMWYCT